jgi:lactoylglutathione lyase
VRKMLGSALVLGLCVAAPQYASAAAAYHHMHLKVPNAEEAVQWYIKHMDCKAVPNRANAADCGTALFLFFVKPPTGPSVGSGANHIGFSFTDLDAKVKALEAAGIKLEGPVRDVKGLFKLAFLSDPWGTRIEIVQHPEYLGFHHVHLSSAEPAKTLAWYQNLFGGENAKLQGMIDGVLYGKVWLLAVAAKEPVVPTEGRAIDHLGFSFPDLDAAAADIKKKGVTFQTEPRALTPPSPSAVKISFITGPDGVRIEVVEPPKK